jgi:hypothetical protein
MHPVRVQQVQQGPAGKIGTGAKGEEGKEKKAKDGGGWLLHLLAKQDGLPRGFDDLPATEPWLLLQSKRRMQVGPTNRSIYQKNQKGFLL